MKIFSAAVTYFFKFPMLSNDRIDSFILLRQKMQHLTKIFSSSKLYISFNFFLGKLKRKNQIYTEFTPLIAILFCVSIKICKISAFLCQRTSTVRSYGNIRYLMNFRDHLFAFVLEPFWIVFGVVYSFVSLFFIFFLLSDKVLDTFNNGISLPSKKSTFKVVSLEVSREKPRSVKF